MADSTRSDANIAALEAAIDNFTTLEKDVTELQAELDASRRKKEQKHAAPYAGKPGLSNLAAARAASIKAYEVFAADAQLKASNIAARMEELQSLQDALDLQLAECLDG